MTDLYPSPPEYVHQPWVGYVVLSGSYADLGETVRKHLEVGWLPQGGVSVFGEVGKARFYQAMYHPDWKSS